MNVLNIWPLVVLLAAGMLYSIKAGKLTIMAAITGALLAVIIFAGTSYNGVLQMTVFFIMGSVATGVRLNKKKQYGLAEENKGRRTTSQVLANTAIASVASLWACLQPHQQLAASVALASAFAAAAADTVSSELGNAFGTAFYNIISLKKDVRGKDGVISLQGTLAGLAASGIIALIHSMHYGFSAGFVAIVLGGTVGNFTDSVLGATLERQQKLGNNAVNFLNTCAGAAAGLLCYTLVFAH